MNRNIFYFQRFNYYKDIHYVSDKIPRSLFYAGRFSFSWQDCDKLKNDIFIKIDFESGTMKIRYAVII